MHYRILSLIITICAFAVSSANAQSYRLYSTRDGLCSTQVNRLLEDNYGMIWMATEDGLSRFDGVKFVNYQHNKDDARSLSHDYVNSMFEDKDGHMIVSTHAGIQMYCPETDDFSALAKSKDGKTDLPSASSFLQRKNGELWVLSDKIYKLTISGQSLTGEPLNLPFPPGSGSKLLEDQQGNIWLLKGTRGVWKLDIQGRVTHYLGDPSMPDFSEICEDHGGRIYVGTTNSGVYCYDSKLNDFSQIKDPAIQNEELCAFLMQDDTYLLLGTGSNGVKVYNTKTNEVYAFQRGDGLVDYSLMKVHALLKDHSGNLWVSVYKKGVMMFPSQTNFFNYIGQHSFSDNLIGSCTVTSIMRDHEGILWVGTDNDGIYALDNHTQKAHISPRQGAAPTTFSLFEDSDNNIWFGSYTKGMGKLDRKTLQCTYRTDIKDADGRQVLHVYDIKEDKEKRLWIATLGSGLYCLDLKTNTISFNKEVNEKISSSWQYCVLPTSDNKLLVGTHRGLFSVDLNTFGVNQIIDKQIINCLHEDNQGRIWVGTSSGVVCWNPANNKYEYYTTSEGLADNTVNAILHDERGNIWFTTNRGIGLLNPAQKTIVNYYANDGLQVVEFSQNAFCQLSSGILFFGGVDGLVYFRPEEITNPGKKWTVRINDLYLYGSRIHGGTLSGGKEIITGPVYLAEEFRLSHSDNSFSIEFSTQEYNAPERLDFLYAFDDDKWQRVPHGEHLLSFSNLSPGTYKLRIKAVDNGVESNVKEVSVVIVPHLWESWWAYCLYALLGVLVCWIIWYERVQRRKANQKIAEQLREDQQKEQRLQFLINMAHEIRTPMTLVISPLQELMETDASEEHQRQYKTMFRNSERILSLINQLMDVRKIDEGQMSLSFREQLVDSVARPLHELFQLQAERRRIDLQYINNAPDLKLWLDVSHFDKIIANLLSNAMKFTPDGGTIRLMIRETKDNCALIEVSDSGKGISSDDMEHIFERFYQTKNHETTSHLGTGIGLHLAYELVRLHCGKIWVENHVDSPGCSFFVEIPKGTAHLNPEDIVHVPIENNDNLEETRMLAAQSEGAEVLKSRVGNKPRLLIVEDDEEIRAYLSNELSKDYLVSLAVNGKEGLEEVFRRMPDIIISDIMMPEMDGVTLCKKIRQNVNLNHIPIILLTAKTRIEDAVVGLDAGADDYVTKPFQLTLLRKKLQTLLQSRERLRNAFQGNQLQEKKYKKVEMKSPDERLMDRIMKVINENLDNPDLTVEMITHEVGISRVHLHRKLKELTNQTTRDFVRNVRLKQAAILLSEKRCSVAEVAEKVGYPNTSNFSTAFKEVYGVSPKAYMEQSEKENLE